MVLRDVLGQVQTLIFGKSDPLTNRRREARIPCDFPVLCKVGSQDDLEARLVDLGTRGMKLVLPLKVKRSQEVRVSALPGDASGGRQRLRCQVAWAKPADSGFEAGLRYADTPENLATSWVQFTLVRLNCHLGERRDRRITAGVPVEIHDSKGAALGQGTILDLSLGGAMINVASRLPDEQTLRVQIGTGQGSSIFLLARVVSRPENPNGDGILHSIRFFPADTTEQQRLRSLLMTLLDGLRQQKAIPIEKPRPLPKTRQGTRPELRGPLQRAVLPRPLPAAPEERQEEPEPEYGFQEPTLTPVKLEERRRATYPSRFLRSAGAPDVMEAGLASAAPPSRPPAARPQEPPEQREADSDWSEYGPANAEGLASPQALRPAPVPTPHAVPARPLRRTPPPARRHPLDEVEVLRGWSAMLCEEPPPLDTSLPEGLSEGFFVSVLPAMIHPPLGPALAPGVVRLEAEPVEEMLTRGPIVNFPALPWAYRSQLAVLSCRARNCLEWLGQTLMKRQKLEKRLFGPEEVAHHFLALLALGGETAIASLVQSGRIAVRMCRLMGIGDGNTLQLVHYAALLKDLGEMAFLMGRQPRGYRERVNFYLNALDTPEPGRGADLHKLRIPADLYLRLRRLSPDEQAYLHVHPQLGQDLLAQQVGLARLAPVVRAHHERWDGGGYPDGLRGEAIPVAARCLAVADVYCTLLLSDLTPENAAALIRSGSGSYFDPTAVKAFQRLVETDELG